MSTNHKPVALLVHGFNVSDGGARTTDKLRPYLETAGYHVAELDYNWTGLIGVRMCNKRLAKVIARMTHLVPGKLIAIGHSNGCAILQAASMMGAKFDQLVFINPALNASAKVGEQVRYVHVWHSPSDTVVKIAKWLPFHKWGNMGAVGYTGTDPRFFNYNKEAERWRYPDGTQAKSKKHSDVFKQPLLGFYAGRIIHALRHADETGEQW